MTESAKVCKVPVTFSPSFKTMICYILIIMTTLAWEHLPKSSIENETIEQAIVRIVAAHNQDNTAHMQEGGSIDIHRKESVLDHKAGSVLADKETMSEYKFATTFESLELWDVVGNVDHAGILGCRLYLENGEVDESSIYAMSPALGNFLNTYKDMVFQTIIKVDFSTGTSIIKFGQFSQTLDSNNGFGFIVQNGLLKTFIGDAVWSHTSNINSISVSVPHIYRAQYIAGERKIYWFVDGVEVDTYTLLPSQNLEDDSGLYIGTRTGTMSDGYVEVSNIVYARQI